MIEAIRSSETSVLTKDEWRQILEDGILHSHRRENLKSHTPLNAQIVSLTVRGLNAILHNTTEFFFCGCEINDK
jgi:hypothetical protein